MQSDSEFLKELRKKNRLSQRELAEIIDVTSSYIGQVEIGKCPLSDKVRKVIDEHFSSDNKNPECINIPIREDIEASMGYGVTVYNECQTAVYSISKKLAHDLGINPKQTDMIFAKGNSMYPTIISGDSLIVDLSKKEIYDGKIYCIRIDGQLYAKRLQKISSSKIKIISDNKDYDAIIVDFNSYDNYDFEVIGEVRWAGRVFE